MAGTGKPKLIVHGGAGKWVGFDEEAVLNGVRAAAQAGWAVLQRGGAALDAVEAATLVLEDDPLFDAGYGSFLNEQGEAEMDALLTDGRDIRFGAVAAVRRVQHPITLARLVMTRTENCFFVGEGADQLAASLGIPQVANVQMITEREFSLFRERSRIDQERPGQGTGTVGAAALDSSGHLASATSTGGTPDKKKGRVGDSPMFGSGGYADDQHGAASATGRGENIMRFFLSKQVVDRIIDGQNAAAAARAGMDYLCSHIAEPEAGIIVVGADGSIAAHHTTPAMPVAWVDGDGVVHTAMKAAGLFK
jgi:L-asparaginase / beta-aspartyl-peptidase